MIAVRPYTPDEAECWNELVAQSRNGTFLFDRRYMDYHSDRFADHSLLFSERGKTVALLPANRCGDTLHSHQGLTYGGLVMSQGVTTAKACEMLAKEGFIPMPYMYPDLNAARDMVNAGAAAIMPLAAPIGSNQGLATKSFIRILIEEIDLPIIVDAGIGKPSQACEAMEMGASAIMANTAIATAGNIVEMAEAFRHAIIAGRTAYLAGTGRVLDRASASSPLTGFLQD